MRATRLSGSMRGGDCMPSTLQQFLLQISGVGGASCKRARHLDNDAAVLLQPSLKQRGVGGTQAHHSD